MTGVGHLPQCFYDAVDTVLDGDFLTISKVNKADRVRDAAWLNADDLFEGMSRLMLQI